MALFKKKAAPAVAEPMDLDAVMKKYDRESNTRVWEGTPRLVVNIILALFSLFSIVYLVTLRKYMKSIFLGDSEDTISAADEFVSHREGESFLAFYLTVLLAGSILGEIAVQLLRYRKKKKSSENTSKGEPT